mgnify:CR=1 FL=1
MSKANKPQSSLNDDGTPRRKYELDLEEESKIGIRAALGLVFGASLAILKNALFGDTPSNANAAPKTPAEPSPQGEADQIAEAQADDADAPPEEAGASGKKTKGSGVFLPNLNEAKSYYPEDSELTKYKLAGSSSPPSPVNDNVVLYRATPGSGIDLTTSGASSTARSTTTPEADPALPPNEDETEDDRDSDPKPSDTRANRLPVIAAPVILADIMVNQPTFLLASDLLRHASDADGDVLSVQSVRASSGSLVARDATTYVFMPDPDDLSPVTFSYDVSDGHAVVEQVAYLTIKPIEARPNVGTPGPDTLLGTDDNDVIDGLAGDDTILGLDGNDVIFGSDGDDRIFGGRGNDVLFGGDGDDVIFAGEGDDIVYGGSGNDVIHGEDGNDTLFGEAGNDIIFGGKGDDLVMGGEGNDLLHGDEGNDHLDGGEGDDEIHGGSGADVIIGGEGRDIAYGGDGDDIFVATIGDGDDVYDGGDGRDTYDASRTTADATIDLAAGTASSTDIGHDTLVDIENAVGGSGNDIIVANELVNHLTGGAGLDIFVFQSSRAIGFGVGNRDKILDFEVGDRIDIRDLTDEFPDEFKELFESVDIRRFVLISQHEEFSRPGQMRFKYEDIDGAEVTVLEGNIDYDLAADFQIEIIGNYVLNDDDFHWRC